MKDRSIGDGEEQKLKVINVPLEVVDCLRKSMKKSDQPNLKVFHNKKISKPYYLRKFITSDPDTQEINLLTISHILT